MPKSRSVSQRPQKPDFPKADIVNAKLAELQARIQDSFQEKIPEGFHSARELANEWDCSVAYVNMLMCKAVHKGIWERKRFRRGKRSIYHYREIQA